ncbi:7-cyano-7-deazaguanine synthase [subsurface metagenome]
MVIKKAIVLASGGIDSTACISFYKELGYDVEALFINYGHPANPIEHTCLEKICRNYKIPLSLLKLSGVTIDSQREIRGRNAFLILSALLARPIHSGLLSIGIHSGIPYYDCGERFISKIADLVSDYTKGTVKLDLPLIDMDKLTVIQYCKIHKVPLELTYSCEAGSVPPCGKCPSCKDRIAAGLRE